GQRRLPGFSGEWGTKTLGQLGNFSKGKGLPKNDLCTDGDIPAIPYTAIYTEFSEIIEYECINDFTVSNESIFISEPHILIAGSSNMLENVGKATAYNDYREVAIGGDIILFKTEADVRFISYLLNTQTHRKKIILLSQGSTIRHVYSSTFVNYEIGIPLLKEQQAIAEILSDMDAEINALEQRRAKTRLLKQGMMQELLTGRTRLVDN
ncbi:MAG: restriction endonuclease subunit S, partial [Chloroflexi bacterium]|nr:restriction endonuclease subunit S [Chloroflexota bacterium]